MPVSGEYNRAVMFSYFVDDRIDGLNDLLCFGNGKTSIDKIILWINPDEYIVRLLHNTKNPPYLMYGLHLLSSLIVSYCIVNTNLWKI